MGRTDSANVRYRLLLWHANDFDHRARDSSRKDLPCWSYNARREKFMESPTQPRGTPARLSDSLRHNLNMYALAATAAGVSLLALVQPSEGEIVYTKTHHVIGWNRAYQLDLNHDGVIDFLILHFGSSMRSGGSLLTKEAFGNAVQGSWFSNTLTTGSRLLPYDAALKPGAPIGPGQGFISCGACNGETMARGDQGNWFNVKNRYLGLRFQIRGRNHYGWARLNVQVDRKHRLTALLTGYAYETIPNKAIQAGQTASQGVLDPASREPQQSEPQNTAVKEARPRRASLGALAIGAQSIPSRRCQ
jgi:hypothetical protein